ncbi:MAG: hypothetical protein ABI852_13440 [Gemmatimonadaceae bacterium]
MTSSISASVHPTAIVDADAKFGEGVTVGPWAIIGPGCVLGDGSSVAARATLEKNVTLGRNVQVGIGSVLGGDPQDRTEEGHLVYVWARFKCRRGRERIGHFDFACAQPAG